MKPKEKIATPLHLACSNDKTEMRPALCHVHFIAGYCIHGHSIQMSLHGWQRQDKPCLSRRRQGGGVNRRRAS